MIRFSSILFQIELTCNCRIGITSIFMVIPLTPLTIKKFIAGDFVFLHELICRKGQVMIPVQSVDIKLHCRRQSIDICQHYISTERNEI